MIQNNYFENKQRNWRREAGGWNGRNNLASDFLLPASLERISDLVLCGGEVKNYGLKTIIIRFLNQKHSLKKGGGNKFIRG